jgi:hypothetical protein
MRLFYDIDACTSELAAAFSIEIPRHAGEASMSPELTTLASIIQDNSVKLAEVEDRLQTTSLDDDEKRYLIGNRERYASAIREATHQRILLEERTRSEERKQEGERGARVLIETLHEVTRQLESNIRVADVE